LWAHDAKPTVILIRVGVGMGACVRVEVGGSCNIHLREVYTRCTHDDGKLGTHDWEGGIYIAGCEEKERSGDRRVRE